MHAVGAARNRHVDAIVDDDASGAAATHTDRLGHERDQIDGVDIGLPDLDQIDTGLDSEAALRDDALPRDVEVNAPGQSSAIGHQT